MSLYKRILLDEKASSCVIKCDNERYSYGELISEIGRMAKSLEKDGVTINSKVLVLVEDPLRFVITLFAISKVNAVCIPLYAQTGEEKIIQIIKKYEINHVIRSLSREKKRLSFNNSRYINDDYIIYKINEKNDKELTGIGLLLFTSGTTSVPKAIMLSIDNIISNINSISDYLRPITDDKLLIIKNLSHSSSIIGELLVGIKNGCTVVLSRKLPVPVNMLNILQNEQISIFFAVPTLLQGIIEYGKNESFNLSNLRIINFYGAKMGRDNIFRLINCFPTANIIYSYGLTEASPRVTYIEKKDLIKKTESSGKAIRDVKVSIENTTGEIMNGYEIGEIVVTGPNVMKGYYKDLERTKATVIDGKLYTKDIGYIDDEGYLYVSGRKDNMFISAGKNVYPEEIEGVLTSHASIQEALVDYSINENGTALITAYVRTVDDTVLDTSSVLKHCLTRLENYKIPWRIVQVKEFNKTPSGKIIRNHIM